ncbi:type II toxin-antitoxin system RelE/ParE family toxin [Actinospica durhamensis]|uniref:Type II toxin-antitoxin system RelE/ParE family toxin n=1 Tax=Actinospica durhamensis TaxID=1508375 RepID=A0A941ISZ5_9ACTN|nr:type II toxin-antitoxin system RelE/ParE family toxin [Actinospica durhamensis]MBR7833786.1 type II toxin-antitoxin system RelE/ParE family toxin [Actinospica durhamensis]
MRLEIGPLFKSAAVEAAKEDQDGFAELHSVLRLLPSNPRPDDSAEWSVDDFGELRRLRYAGYRVLYVIDEAQDRVVLIRLGRDAT